MNIKEIKALAEILSQNNLTKLEYSQGDSKILLEKQNDAVVQSYVQAPVAMATDVESDLPQPLDFNNITEVKSPIVGVFYPAASPEAQPFVTIGSKVKKGDVLCIIEAMKLMNEIIAEDDGEIVDVCVKSGDIIEFGQVIFKIF